MMKEDSEWVDRYDDVGLVPFTHKGKQRKTEHRNAKSWNKGQEIENSF